MLIFLFKTKLECDLFKACWSTNLKPVLYYDRSSSEFLCWLFVSMHTNIDYIYIQQLCMIMLYDNLFRKLFT